MCDFVFVGVTKTCASVVADTIKRAGLFAAPTGNPCLLAAFPPNDILSVVTDGHCSCGLADERVLEFDADAERQTLHKKGWPDAKIERLVFAKRRREKAQFLAFREAFAHIVQTVNSARIMAHEFSGLVEEETMSLMPPITLSLGEFLARGGTYPHDTICDVQLSESTA